MKNRSTQKAGSGWAWWSRLKSADKSRSTQFFVNRRILQGQLFLQKGAVFSLLQALVWKYVMKMARIAAVPDISSRQNF